MTAIGLLVAFGGGIFGAAIGALSAFSFIGFLTMIGVAIQLSVAPEATDFFGVPFGAFGPHVGGFASGVAAAAYAAHKGKLESGRNIVTAGMGLNSPDVLLVGGAFGILGYVLCWIVSQVPEFGPGLAWTDYPGICVVISAFIARLLWGKTGIFGKAEKGRKFFDPTDSTKWLAFQSECGQLAVIGLGVGLLGGWLGITYGMTGALLAFGIAAASLFFLALGLSLPVTHHIALPAAIVGAASGSMIWACIAGLVCAYAGEVAARLFLCHGDTHIDPPACTIALMTMVFNFLTAVGFWAMIPMPV
ncbi:permease [Cohaesibacter celericrescens]|uniref:Permease n=1 Tax=Cohaesibacter celericrescens TaxID=2067669 RepID=A0A2N5XQP7_9HYPH|nr:permease [Cohaesibacter celericrescens]PLW76846.1 permease [Cohaesibacter celericrescens]